MLSYRRIASGTAANGVSLVFAAIFNLATTPALILAWGPTGYGIWVMLTAIPTYFALSDLGFATAARNTMAMTIARGERARTISVFQSLIALHLAVFAIMLAVTGLVLVFLTVWSAEFAQQYGWSIALLSVLSCLLMFARVILSALLAAGHYAKGTLSYDIGAFVANMVILPGALLGADFTTCLLIQIACWLGILAALWRVLAQTVDWLRVGVGCASLSILRELLWPAVGSLAIPGALALNQQGAALIIGLTIGPAATAAFTAVRTATRLAIQAISVINRATVLELFVASARQNKPAVVRILWINVLSAAFLLTPIAILSFSFGPEIIGLWTGGAIVPASSFVVWMTIGMILHACWYFGTNLLMATNAHLSMVGVLLFTSVVTIALSWPAAHYFSLTGAAILLAAAEAACLLRFWFAARSAEMTLPSAALVELLRDAGRRARLM